MVKRQTTLVEEPQRAQGRRTPLADKKIRVLVAKPGLDGHDRGAKVGGARLARCRHGSYLYGLEANP